MLPYLIPQRFQLAPLFFPFGYLVDPTGYPHAYTHLARGTARVPASRFPGPTCLALNLLKKLQVQERNVSPSPSGAIAVPSQRLSRELPQKVGCWVSLGYIQEKPNTLNNWSTC